MSERHLCTECGSAFFAVSDAWGDRICGDCIASRIGLSLFPMALRAERKPMRRAPEGGAAVLPSEREQRKAG